MSFEYIPDNKEYCKCPKCGGDAEVDTSVVLTSNPPQYSAKCTKCGNLFYIYCSEPRYGIARRCERTTTKIGRSCDICGELAFEIDIDNWTVNEKPFVICDKCKNAIMAMRDFIYPPKEEEK